MSNRAALGLETDLSAAPWEYPGPMPATSGLLLGEYYNALTTVQSRRLGQSRISIKCEVDGERGDELPLNYLLLSRNVAAVDARTLVVAIGSNASPAVMRGKLKRGGQSQVLPMVRGTLDGFSVAHSAHVSASGYVAAAPRSDTNARGLSVVAALLDEKQLRCLDATEPNYVLRTCISGLTLESGERPAIFYLYTSKWGLLAPPGGPVPNFGSQQHLLDYLATAFPELLDAVQRHTGLDSSSLRDPHAVLTALGRDETLREQLQDLLAAAGWAAASGLDDLPAAEHTNTYGQTTSRWLANVDEDALEIRVTSDTLDRRGEPSIVLHPDDARRRALSSHAVVRAALPPDRRGALARVVPDERQPTGTVGVDQVVRNALGVELGERALLTPAYAQRNRLADTLIARPHYVMCRVQTADLATVEQPVCLLAPLAMGILGLDGGDEVIVEGMPGPQGDVRTIRLKAHAVPGDVQQRRETIGGGQLDSRFPSARDALAVHPDLPWLFLDSVARTSLGLTGKLAAVRVRASRRYQWSEEIRELLLLLVIAFVGLASLIRSLPVLLGALGGISLVTVLLIRTRLRLRLRSEMTGRPEPGPAESPETTK